MKSLTLSEEYKNWEKQLNSDPEKKMEKREFELKLWENCYKNSELREGGGEINQFLYEKSIKFREPVCVREKWGKEEEEEEERG